MIYSNRAESVARIDVTKWCFFWKITKTREIRRSTDNGFWYFSDDYKFVPGSEVYELERAWQLSNEDRFYKLMAVKNKEIDLLKNALTDISNLETSVIEGADKCFRIAKDIATITLQFKSNPKALEND